MSTSSTFFIGPDVHKETKDAAYCVDNSRDEPVFQGTIPTNIRSINKLIKKYKDLASHLVWFMTLGFLHWAAVASIHIAIQTDNNNNVVTQLCPCCQHPMHCTALALAERASRKANSIRRMAGLNMRMKIHIK
ncbi:hypothetical protein AHAT_42400 [Agarivorans sp. Toyoura001]|uniref:IS110 family transposase n=1 Tax=Agarivorans sp. Toyoura001 TaxID=2283141 RepID=UPI0010F1926D|nr:IS110 family transposase [Agarivorans sp. Toyoura001]GDY28350.1 hypothetical protein AHAT_42400 [Agarivorans sp. Toyoura001]